MSPLEQYFNILIFPPNRIFWTLVVCTGIALFFYQVGNRLEYYWQDPISVNIEVNYNQTLQFPALTICNQNLFRYVLFFFLC